ncbi:MAG: gas vesicle protein [Planctomycetota bacterium]
MAVASQPGTQKRLTLRERRAKRVGRDADKPVERATTLVETLDRVLERGIVVQGEVVISVAEVPLIYVGLQALVSSVETAAQAIDP